MIVVDGKRMAEVHHDEETARDILCRKLKRAGVVVETDAHLDTTGGTADILIRRTLRVIEIESFDDWTDGVGKLLEHSLSLGNYHKVLFLYGEERYRGQLGWREMKWVCLRANIYLMKESDTQRLVQESKHGAPKARERRRKTRRHRGRLDDSSSEDEDGSQSSDSSP